MKSTITRMALTLFLGSVVTFHSANAEAVSAEEIMGRSLRAFHYAGKDAKGKTGSKASRAEAQRRGGKASARQKPDHSCRDAGAQRKARNWYPPPRPKAGSRKGAKKVTRLGTPRPHNPKAGSGRPRFSDLVVHRTEG